jgi:hypothetical protein
MQRERGSKILPFLAERIGEARETLAPLAQGSVLALDMGRANHAVFRVAIDGSFCGLCQLRRGCSGGRLRGLPSSPPGLTGFRILRRITPNQPQKSMKAALSKSVRCPVVSSRDDAPAVRIDAGVGKCQNSLNQEPRSLGIQVSNFTRAKGSFAGRCLHSQTKTKRPPCELKLMAKRTQKTYI